MEKQFTDEKTGISYTMQGDYFIPDLALPAEEENAISIYGQRHLRFLKQHKRVLYINLLSGGKLNAYLAGIDKQAHERLHTLIQQMAQVQGVTEELKATDQIAWVGAMNNIRYAAEEIINRELIFV